MNHSSRNYPLLLIGQFLGAFGDNAILAVIVGQLTYLQKAGTISAGELRTSNTIYTSLLFVPYVLLAPLAGYLNDRYAKTHWLVGGNTLKLFGTVICALSIWHGTWWQGVGYFIVGIGACIYGPAKYGILPEILPREKLVKANGMVELLTLVAILGGAIAGSVMADVFKDRVSVSYVVLAGIFATALLFNFFMSATPHKPGIKLSASVHEFTSHLGTLFTAGRLGRVLIGTALFWVCGAAMKINFQPWGLEVLNLPDNTQIALLGLWLSVGVMAGSIVAGQVHQVGDLTKTRLYGFLLAGVLALMFTVNSFGFWKTPTLLLGSLHLVVPVVLLLIAAGFAAGLFLIPLNAALQAECDPTKLGKTIAVQNLFDNLGMLLAGAYVFIGVKAGLSSSGIFLGLALGVAAIVTWFKFSGKKSAVA
ncbi:MFS transporter [Oleiharenicola lentus]|uniref:MFS transporter n=1 Tax=Oleiharenicola lentus TaxID=2508720 RepID=UPI003F673B3C